jgi:ParB family transcriptional regulator, chromosome partitioning protein
VNVLKIEYVATDDLIPYINNSRTHSESQIKQIAASIREFGFTNPILIDEGGSVIAGHGRLVAAELLDLDQVPTITLEGLTDAQRKAYVIADNKLALNSGWDFETLQNEIDLLKELDFDISIIGFDDSELNFEEIDYSALDGESVDSQLDDMASGVRKAIQIEFEPDHYEEAQSLVKFWREQGAYVGYMLMEYLRKEKDKL